MKNNKYGLTVTSIQKYGFKKALEVWEKYDKKCSSCGSENCLVVHHIDGSGKTENPNNSLNNLELLCVKCHGIISANQRWRQKQEEFGGYIYRGREKEYNKEYDERPSRIQWKKEYERKRYAREKLNPEIVKIRKASREKYYYENKKQINERRKEYNKKYNKINREHINEMQRKRRQKIKELLI